MGKYDDPRITGLGRYLPELKSLAAAEIEAQWNRPTFVVIRYCEWTAVISASGIGGPNGQYLNIDVHGYSRDTAHMSRVIGFPYGRGELLGNGHAYPLVAVIVGEDREDQP